MDGQTDKEMRRTRSMIQHLTAK